MTANTPKTYVVLEDGIDFRTIAKVMTKGGYPMNHATARNVWIMAMRNFITELADEVGIDITEDTIDNMLLDQELHSSLGEVLVTANRGTEFSTQ